MVLLASVLVESFPVYSTFICIQLHWVVFRHVRKYVYAVLSPGPVPYSAQMMFSLVGFPARNAPVMKLSLFHRDAQSMVALSVVVD